MKTTSAPSLNTEEIDTLFAEIAANSDTGLGESEVFGTALGEATNKGASLYIYTQ